MAAAASPSAKTARLAFGDTVPFTRPRERRCSNEDGEVVWVEAECVHATRELRNRLIRATAVVEKELRGDAKV